MVRAVSRNRLRAYWPLVLIIIALLARASLFGERPTDDAEVVLGEQLYKVARVVDGDTLLLEGGTRVRLQGIDTPETVKPNSPVEPWGPEASQFTKDFIHAAEGEVKLTFGKERLDDYGRQLAFVWHDGALLNEELVRQGLAHARLGYRYSGTMKRRFATAEQEARDARRGLWSGTKSNPSTN